jgi:23S rRNA pseudouridine2604 synthase
MAWTKRYHGPEPQRVNKWLASEGVCSRREAEALIADGRVAIDGARVDDVGRKIEPGQTLSVSAVDAAFTAVLNKPVGYVSAQPEPGQTPAARLITRANYVPAASSGTDGKMLAVPESLAPLGRLDQDSRGLLLLSDDGVLAKAVIGPDANLEKEYLVRVDGVVSERKLALLRRGLALDGRALKPAKISVVEPQRLRFILQEGRNRQIRRMCEAVDLDVTDLLRLRIGPLKLGNLKEGKWRALSAAERSAFVRQQSG